MSSDRISRRTALCAALALSGLAGCGFAPALGRDGAAMRLQDAVQVEAPETVAGFALASRISDRLGAPTAPRYRLQVTMTQDRAAAAINPGGDTTRLNLIGTASWSLRALPTGAELAAGTARNFASYSASGSTVATQTAATDAGNRLATVLADQIVADLMARAAALP